MIDLLELLQATGGTVHGPIFARQFSSFSYDSRLLPLQPPPSDEHHGLAPLFVAVKTGKGDGHDFVLEAVARGATGVLCQHPVDLHQHQVTCIVVPDTQTALTAYAQHVLQRGNLTTVGITGSAGKTTSKELIAAVLSRGCASIFRNQGSINGRYGLSIAVGELEPHHELAVLELAADSFGEIRDLAMLTQPQVGVLTAVQEVHLATFGTLAAIADEKGRLLEALPANGLAVLNGDDPHVVGLAGRTRAPIVLVGCTAEADLRATDIIAGPHGLVFTVHNAGFRSPRSNLALGTELVVRSQLLGRHHIPQILAALAVGLWFGVPRSDIVAALAQFPPLPGRLRPLPGRSGSLILDDTVNASPAAVRAALFALHLFKDRPRVAVLGDMWDLGPLEESAHRRIGEQAAGVLDWLVVKGERAQEIGSGALDTGMSSERVFRAYTDADVLRFLNRLLDEDRPAPVILVKGDRPARLERIVAGLLAEPDQASELLVRQSPGWQQVRPLVQDRPTWVEIDLEAIAGNIRQASALVGEEVGICAVLKADGYGHGAVGVARTVLNNGACMVAVACLAEAVVLRRAAIDAPILVLGYTPAWQARDTLRQNVAATVYDLDVARALSQAAADLNRSARVHIKVDTGMGRLGLLPHQVLPFVQELITLPGLIVEGLFTHFSAADSDQPEHLTHTEAQLAAFEQVIQDLQAAGIEIPLIHTANSAAMVTRPASHYNMIRLGIALYGLAPSPSVILPAGFRPALSWKTQIAQVKTLPAGSPVSYGNTYCTERETAVAVIPVGYADGFRRAPRHWGYVLVRGQPAPIIGRVTMDQTMLDVTDIPGTRQGDEVVLIGRQGDMAITVEEVAERLGTINYEVVSEILARVPRVV